MELLCIAFGKDANEALRRFRDLAFEFVPSASLEIEVPVRSPIPERPRTDPAPPSESSLTKPGLPLAPQVVDLVEGVSEGSPDIRNPLEEVVAVHEVDPGVDLADDPKRVGVMCVLSSGVECDALELESSWTLTDAPDPGAEAWRSWADSMWRFTQTRSATRAERMVIIVVADEDQAREDAASLSDVWRESEEGRSAVLRPAAVVRLMCIGDASHQDISVAPSSGTTLLVSLRDENRLLGDVGDVNEQVSLALLGLWLSGDEAAALYSAPSEASLVAVGSALVCLPRAESGRQRQAMQDMLALFLERNGSVDDRFAVPRLVRDRLELDPVKIDRALMAAPTSGDNPEGDLRQELVQTSFPRLEYSGRRYWGDQLRNLRRLQIESMRLRLLGKLNENFESWLSQLRKRVPLLVSDLMQEQLELPVVSWVLHKLNEAISLVDMHTAGWPGWHVERDGLDFDASVEALEAALREEPHPAGTFARYGLASIAAAPLVVWLAGFVISGLLGPVSPGAVTFGAFALVVFLGLLGASVSVSRVRRRIAGLYEAAFTALNDALIGELHSYASDKVSEALSSVHKEVETAAASVRRFVIEHEQLSKELLVAAPRVSGRSVLEADRSPLELEVSEAPVDRAMDVAGLAKEFVSGGLRTNLLDAPRAALRSELAHFVQERLDARHRTLEAGLSGSNDACRRVVVWLDTATVIRYPLSTQGVDRKSYLLTSRPSERCWDREGLRSTEVVKCAHDVPLTMLMRVAWLPAGRE